MKKIVLWIMLTLLLVSFAFNLQATECPVPPETEWTRTYGGTNDDRAFTVVGTSDGGYAIAGITRSFGAGDYDFWLVKTDASGNMQWNKTYGGTSSDWIGLNGMERTSDGGYALVGWTWSFGAGGSDIWLIKLDSLWNEEWNKTYGGTGRDFADSVVQTNDGGYAMAGCTGSFGVGAYDFYLVKTYANGTMQWDKTYGGTNYEEVHSVVQTSDGGYALVGYTRSFGSGNEDLWLVKTDAYGNVQWNKTYGGTDNDKARCVVETSEGGYAMAGLTRSFGAGDYDFWLVKTDAYGNVQWNKTYGGTNGDHNVYVVETRDGGYAIAGQTNSFGAGAEDFWVVKTDAQGNAEWNKTYGGTNLDTAYCVVETSDGGYAIAGMTRSFGAGEYDFLLVKLMGKPVPDETVLPFWAQWWFWTNIALGITTTVFALTTVHYRRKAQVPKEPKVISAKPVSKKEYKVCPNCGAKLPVNSAFCGKCGTSLK